MKNLFKITIGSSPLEGSKVPEYLNHDLQLIKAGLLYSDQVEVCSPMGNLIHSLKSLHKMSSSNNFDDKIHLLEYLRSISPDNIKLQEILKTFRLLGNKKHLSGREILLKRQLLKEIDTLWKFLQNTDFELFFGDKVNDILKLQENGLIDYYYFDVTSIDVRETLLKQFTDFITKAISDPYSYPLLDDLSGLFISEQIMAGEIKVSKPDIDKSKHVQLAADLFERLPNFDLASIDEILDIKNELNPYLINFRSGMINFSELISCSQWSIEFEREAEIIFRKNIEPSVKEIEEIAKTKSYLRSLISRFANKPLQGPIPILGVALVGQVTNLAILSLIVDGLVIGANLYDIYKNLEEEKLSIKQNQLFFYYKAKNILNDLKINQ